eukprot:1887701-Pleurochrysis_carterae.AAC.1
MKFTLHVVWAKGGKHACRCVEMRRVPSAATNRASMTVCKLGPSCRCIVDAPPPAARAHAPPASRAHASRLLQRQIE